MPRPVRTSKKTTRRGRSAAVRPRRRRWWVGVLILLILVVLAVYGRPSLARWARHLARQHMDSWAISEAERWLSRAVWLDPGNSEAALMQAACYRRWGQTDRWRTAMHAAEKLGATVPRIEQEIALSLVRTGQALEGAAAAHIELLDAGIHPDDVASALVEGYLARGDYERAEGFLRLWDSRPADDPHADYLWGFYYLQLQDYELAQERFQAALFDAPDHELARKMLAELLEMQDRLGEALEQHYESVQRFPTSAVAKVGLARTLRKLSYTEAARQILIPLVAQPDPLAVALQEKALLELESSNYQAAQDLIRRAERVQEMPLEQLLPAAITSILLSDTARANQIIDRYDELSYVSVRSYDLQIRLFIDPDDRQAAQELQQLASRPTGHATDQRVSSVTTSSAAELYAQHCSACHGANGDGNGRGSRHLYPRARNFRMGNFRLVSTVSGVPTMADLSEVIRRGVPGTSMPAFEELSQSERNLLAEEVLRLYQDGIASQFREQVRRTGEATSAEEVQEFVDTRTTAGEVVQPPPIGSADAHTLSRGKQLYAQLGCHQCHGTDGSGTTDIALYDDLRRPTRPRDLIREPMKGGGEAESLFLRLRVGMPGTPHPAARTTPSEQLIDLVHYCQSLSREPKVALNNYQRAQLAKMHAK